MGTTYDRMSKEQQLLCNQAMDLYAEWLNLWMVEMGTAEEKPVTRDSFMEYNDPPRLNLDVTSEALWNERLMLFVMSPYHDEGGPSAMVCYYHDGELVHMTQEFDTMIQTIYDATNDNRPGVSHFHHTPDSEREGS